MLKPGALPSQLLHRLEFANSTASYGVFRNFPLRAGLCLHLGTHAATFGVRSTPWRASRIKRQSKYKLQGEHNGSQIPQ
jgi:hypothetical protein